MSYNPLKKALRIINFKPRNYHTSGSLFKENVVLKLIDKVYLENILFVNKCFNSLLPIFNDWFTLVSAQRSYQTSSSTKEKNFKPPFKTISYGKNYIILLWQALFSHRITHNKS